MMATKKGNKKAKGYELVVIETCGVRREILLPKRRSQYTEAWLEDEMWRRFASEKELGRLHRVITLGTFISGVLCGRAQNWTVKYMQALSRSLHMSRTVRLYGTGSVGLEGLFVDCN